MYKQYTDQEEWSTTLNDRTVSTWSRTTIGAWKSIYNQTKTTFQSTQAKVYEMQQKESEKVGIRNPYGAHSYLKRPRRAISVSTSTADTDPTAPNAALALKMPLKGVTRSSVGNLERLSELFDITAEDTMKPRSTAIQPAPDHAVPKKFRRQGSVASVVRLSALAAADTALLEDTLIVPSVKTSRL